MLAPELLRGRVIDTRTAQGIRELWVRLRPLGEDGVITAEGVTTTDVVTTTDERGNFAADAQLPEGPIGASVGLGPEGPWLEPATFQLEHD